MALKPRANKNPQVLEVALAPAPVALGVVDKGRRQFLEASREIRGEPQLVAGATEERGLDEVVTQDLAAERLAPRQAWQTAMPGEGRNADDGVVAPGVTVGHLPKGQTVAEHRAVQAGRELEDAGEQRFAVDGERR